MKNLIKILFLCGIIIFMAFSCDDDEKPINPLIGTWKCIGFGTTESNEIRELEPKNCNECYILTFKKDGTIEGYTSTNEAVGEFEINLSTKELQIINFSGITEINELFDGKEYIETISNVNSYNTNSNDTLLLYYNHQNLYLIFNSVE